MSMFAQRREPRVRMAAVEGGFEDEPNRGGLQIPKSLRGEIHPRQEETGPEAYAPPESRVYPVTGADARLAELKQALVPAVAAPPPPLSEEARKLVSAQDIARSETVRDSLRVMAAARLAEFDEWAANRRAELEAFAKAIYDWGDEHVAKVVAEQEERARLHHRDVDIVYSTQALLEKHGVPLPLPRAPTAEPAAEQKEGPGEPGPGEVLGGRDSS